MPPLLSALFLFSPRILSLSSYQLRPGPSTPPLHTGPQGSKIEAHKRPYPLAHPPPTRRQPYEIPPKTDLPAASLLLLPQAVPPETPPAPRPGSPCPASGRRPRRSPPAQKPSWPPLNPSCPYDFTPLCFAGDVSLAGGSAPASALAARGLEGCFSPNCWRQWPGPM